MSSPRSRPSGPPPWMRRARSRRGRIQTAGMRTALLQLTLKITAPGVPDFYQGTELWDLSMVDPDNRRPIDFAARRRLIAELAPPDDKYQQDRASRAAALLAAPED